MLKRYKNAVFETLQKCGFDPAKFQVEEDNPDGFPTSFTLTLKDTPFSLTIRHGTLITGEDVFSVNHTTHKNYVSGIYSAHGDYKNFSNLLSRLTTWAHSVAQYERDMLEEKQTSDLWAQLEASSPLISDSPIPSDDTSEFTEEEKKMLHQGVQRYRLLVMAEFRPNEEQAKAINDRLDYLEKAIDKLNRFDWKALALSTVISIGINLAVDTEMGNRLFQLFTQAFNAVIKLLPGL